MAAVVKRLGTSWVVVVLSLATTATVAMAAGSIANLAPGPVLLLRAFGVLHGREHTIAIRGLIDAHVGTALAPSKLSNRVGSCDLHRKQAAAVRRTVIVYGKRAGLDTWQGALTIYDACLRPAGKPVEVGRSARSDGEYPANESMSSLRIAGTFVANSSGSSFANESACSKYLGANCEQLIRWWVEVVDVKSRRHLRIRLGNEATSVAVSPAGAVAWVLGTGSPAPVLQAMVLRHRGAGQLTGTARTLDTGAIGRSLRFTGFTLHWTNSGHTKSQTVR